MIDVNEYYDGNVKSLAFQGSGLPATVGVMAPGDYEFGTSQNEMMTVVDGSLTVQLPGASDWQTFTNGQTFDVAANQKFLVKANVATAYHCTYE